MPRTFIIGRLSSTTSRSNLVSSRISFALKPYHSVQNDGNFGSCTFMPIDSHTETPSPGLYGYLLIDAPSFPRFLNLQQQLSQLVSPAPSNCQSKAQVPMPYPLKNSITPRFGFHVTTIFQGVFRDPKW